MKSKALRAEAGNRPRLDLLKRLFGAAPGIFYSARSRSAKAVIFLPFVGVDRPRAEHAAL